MVANAAHMATYGLVKRPLNPCGEVSHDQGCRGLMLVVGCIPEGPYGSLATGPSLEA